jgi:hypothetical protein
VCEPGHYNGFPASGDDDKDTYQLKPGIYSITGQLHLKNNGKIAMYGSTGGVLLYMKDGGVQIKGDLVLRPMDSGIYEGMLLFSNRSNANPIEVSGNGTVNAEGVLYAPGSTSGVSLAHDGAAGMHIGTVIAQKLSISGSGDVCVNNHVAPC